MMTPEEFYTEQQRLLEQLPPEFRSDLSYMAYEQSHSSGYDEVLNTLTGLVYDLKPSIAAFEKRIRSEY